MSRQPRAGKAGNAVTIRVTDAERADWKRAAKQAEYSTLSAAVVSVMNAWAERLLRRGKRP